MKYAVRHKDDGYLCVSFGRESWNGDLEKAKLYNAREEAEEALETFGDDVVGEDGLGTGEVDYASYEIVEVIVSNTRKLNI